VLTAALIAKITHICCGLHATGGMELAACSFRG